MHHVLNSIVYFFMIVPDLSWGCNSDLAKSTQRQYHCCQEGSLGLQSGELQNNGKDEPVFLIAVAGWVTHSVCLG